MYPLDLQEESLKQRVANDFFSTFDYEPLDRIDFAITLKESKNSLFPNIYALWAEAKRGDDADIYASLVQLILTIGVNNLHRIHPIPEFIGAFDANKIAFLPYKYIKDFVMRNDFDWTSITPSEHRSEAFLRMQSLTSEILRDKSIIFSYAKDTQALQDFIKNSVAKGKNNPIEIDLENFDSVYLQWYRIVLPTINLNQNAWKYARDNLIALESDFFLADLLSEDNTTINQNLRILLSKRVENAKEKLHYNIKIDKGLFSWNTEDIVFLNDDNSTHAQFWNRYKRPPKEEFWDKIYERRDKLSPDDIRERKGAFFTPKMWVQKAQEYLAESLGENWQEEYYIWDCAAGTGNLLVGLKNARNIYASTIDLSDVLIMKELIKDSGYSLASTQRNMLESHIFQFDFLNDCFFDKVDEKRGKILTKSKLPESLQNIIKNEPHKLVVFINPPYAEAGNKRKMNNNEEQHKSGVATTNKTYENYQSILGKASNEVFIQFFIRIYKEIPNCILGSFSKLKYLNSTNFLKFRETFKAEFKKGFMCPAWTFDNVTGKYPIGFLVWNLGDKQEIKKTKLDIFENGGKRVGKKNFYASNDEKNIGVWLASFREKNPQIHLAMMDSGRLGFQHQRLLHIANQVGKQSHSLIITLTLSNLIPCCVYFAVRHSIEASWINDRDQFLYPNKKWRDDKQFHNDCLAFTLFHGQNRISANISPSPAEGDKGGGYSGYSGYINHFIPFSESQVGAKEAFKSDFMVRFINGKLGKDDTAQSLRTSKESAVSACKGQAQSKIHKNNVDCQKPNDTERTLPFDKKEIQANTQIFIPTKPLEFSKEAQEVFSAGLALWRYYHAQAKASDKYLNDASLYDIKEYFQGRAQSTNGKKGKMNARSEDNHYNDLIAQLRITLQTLADKITPKIYEYEFLLE